MIHQNKGEFQALSLQNLFLWAESVFTFIQPQNSLFMLWVELNLTKKFALINYDKLVIKWGFWCILKPTLILKATHEANLEINLDFKVQFLYIWSQPLFQRQVKLFRELCPLKNFTPSSDFSQCLTHEFWSVHEWTCEYYHLEWSSCCRLPKGQSNLFFLTVPV